MRHLGYFTRALKANDPRYARVFGKLGYSRSDLSADDQAATPEPVEEDLGALRDEYHRVLGKRPFNGWDAAELRARIAAGPAQP
ncbi:hypothetical protein K7957_05110 [Sphingomonas yunnanensis]|uniref:hypothetical protein n=1 Tax=Sphingomonas yunnanensis TaxID=310400 RepID=UPI001CA67349|nr:hypothetical protein [Sphingomonas yunnanensis]MBY9062308.1 hypothetical protein [Sphingomonas yunnanensis]